MRKSFHIMKLELAKISTTSGIMSNYHIYTKLVLVVSVVMAIGICIGVLLSGYAFLPSLGVGMLCGLILTFAMHALLT